MKHLKKLLIIAVITLGFNQVQAQSKVAHINMQELVSIMPETKKMNDELSRLEKTYIDDISTESKALEAKYKKYQAEAPSQTPEENEKRNLEIEQGKRRLAKSQQVAQQELSKKSNEMLKPILESADVAIKAVAKAQGFDYVLDASMLLVANGKDLMADVKKHLNIQ